MAQSEKNTVTYFPHIIGDGKKIFFIEQKYGNDGYATWFKLLEKLSTTEYHFLNLNDRQEVMYLSAKCRISEEVLNSIITDLTDFGVFDHELWNNKVIWCQSFIDSIQDAYKKRKNKCITKNELFLLLEAKGLLFTPKGRSNEAKSRNVPSALQQSKVKESKVKKTKVKESNGETVFSVSSHSPEFILKFDSFNNWLQKNADLVLKMKKPISIDEYAKISEAINEGKIKKQDVTDVLTAMANKPDLCKKYVSAYLTLLSWIRLRNSNNKSSPPTQFKQPNNGKPFGPISQRKPEIKSSEPTVKEKCETILKTVESFYKPGDFIDFGGAFYNRVEAAGLINHELDKEALQYSFDMWERIISKDPSAAQYEATETKRLVERRLLLDVKKRFKSEDLYQLLIEKLEEAA